MSKIRLLAATAALLLPAGGLALTAGAALASSTGCAFSNGCATLHGTDANGNAVAMDAKYQNKNEILIGFLDNAGDGATSFDGVLHYGKGTKTTSYQDTGLVVSHFLTPTCATPSSKDVPPVVNATLPAATGTITDGGNDLSVSTGPDDLNISGGGTSTLSWAATGSGVGAPIVIAENYGVGCVGLWSSTVTVTVASGVVTATGFPSFTAASPVGGGHIHETNTGSSVDTFTDSVSGGTFSFTALPKGVSQSGGVLTADTSTAVPGLYTSLGVIYTQPDGAIDTASFDLLVTGIKSVTPGAGVPYYTFVYAPHGDWTSQCVTDINGSGALRLFPCTLGKNTGQDFTIDSTNGLLDGSQHHVSDILAAAANSAKSCLTDPSTSNAGTPQSDTADETAPNGRQLYVNGSCAANTNLWSWGT